MLDTLMATNHLLDFKNKWDSAQKPFSQKGKKWTASTRRKGLDKITEYVVETIINFW